MTEPDEALVQTDSVEEESAAATLPWKSIAWGTLLMTVFIVPIATSNFTWLGYELPFTYDMFGTVKVFALRFGLLACVAAWGWHLASAKDATLRRSPSDRLVLITLAWLTITSFFATHVPTAIFGEYTRNGGLLSFVLYAVLFWMTIQLSDRVARVRDFAKTLFWSGVIVSAYGVLQYAGLDPIQWQQVIFESRAFSTYGNPVLLGGFLMFFVPVSAALALSEPRRPWRAVWLAGTLLSIVALLLTFTRGAWIGGVTGLVVLGVIAWRQRVALDRFVDPAFAAVSAGVIGLVVWASARSSGRFSDVVQRLMTLFEFESGSGQTRIQIYRSAVTAIADRPFLGSGLDTFKLVFPAYKTKEFVAAAEYAGVADQAHSEPLQIAVTAGLPGLLLIGALLVSIGVISGRMLFRGADSSREVCAGSPGRILLGGLWAACAGYLVFLLVGISQPEITFLLWMCAGMLVAPYATDRPLPVLMRRSAFAAGLSVVCAVALLGSSVTLHADSQYLRGRLLSDAVRRMEAADAAVALAPYNHTYHTYRGAAHAESAFGEITRAHSSGLNPTSGMRSGFEAAVSSLEDAVEFCPSDRDSHLFLATAYNFGGRYLDPQYYIEALRVVDGAIVRMPNDPQLHYERAAALGALGRPTEAREELEEALGLEPRYAEAAVMLASIYAEVGDTDEALELLEKTESVAPDPTPVTQAIRAIEEGQPIETGR